MYLIDSTAIFSRSDSMPSLEPGHNSKGMHLPQISVMTLFSSARIMPTFARILPGSIGDVSAMSETIDTAGVKKFVIVADKGFFSSGNIKKLKNKHLSYIIPMRRNSSLIPEPDHFMNVFLYDGNLQSTGKEKMMFTFLRGPSSDLRRRRIFSLELKRIKGTKTSSMKTRSILGSYIFFQVLMGT